MQYGGIQWICPICKKKVGIPHIYEDAPADAKLLEKEQENPCSECKQIQRKRNEAYSQN